MAREMDFEHTENCKRCCPLAGSQGARTATRTVGYRASGMHEQSHPVREHSAAALHR